MATACDAAPPSAQDTRTYQDNNLKIASRLLQRLCKLLAHSGCFCHHMIKVHARQRLHLTAAVRLQQAKSTQQSMDQSGQGLVQGACCTSALTSSGFGDDVGSRVDVLRGCCRQSSGQSGCLGGACRWRASCAANTLSAIFNTMHASREPARYCEARQTMKQVSLCWCTSKSYVYEVC